MYAVCIGRSSFRHHNHVIHWSRRHVKRTLSYAVTVPNALRNESHMSVGYDLKTESTTKHPYLYDPERHAQIKIRDTSLSAVNV